jgi:hypothetical protein
MRKMDKQTQRTKYKCENITEIVYQKKKKVKCIQMQPFEHEAYNIVCFLLTMRTSGLAVGMSGLTVGSTATESDGSVTTGVSDSGWCSSAVL